MTVWELADFTVCMLLFIILTIKGMKKELSIYGWGFVK